MMTGFLFCGVCNDFRFFEPSRFITETIGIEDGGEYERHALAFLLTLTQRENASNKSSGFGNRMHMRRLNYKSLLPCLVVVEEGF